MTKNEKLTLLATVAVLAGSQSFGGPRLEVHDAQSGKTIVLPNGVTTYAEYEALKEKILKAQYEREEQQEQKDEVQKEEQKNAKSAPVVVKTSRELADEAMERAETKHGGVMTNAAADWVQAKNEENMAQSRLDAAVERIERANKDARTLDQYDTEEVKTQQDVEKQQEQAKKVKKLADKAEKVATKKEEDLAARADGKTSLLQRLKRWLGIDNDNEEVTLRNGGAAKGGSTKGGVTGHGGTGSSNGKGNGGTSGGKGKSGGNQGHSGRGGSCGGQGNSGKGSASGGSQGHGRSDAKPVVPASQMSTMISYHGKRADGYHVFTRNILERDA